MAQLAKIHGAQKVIMLDINDTRLKMAKQFGVDTTVNSSKEDPINAVLKLTNGKGGLVVFFGGVPRGSMTELDCNLIHDNNIWIKGHFGTSYSQSKRAFQLSLSPSFPTKKFTG